MRLRILATTDLHMHLAGFDYSADRPAPGVGLTRIATLMRAARAEARDQGAAVLVVDNGDGLQGTPLGDLAVRRPSRPHPLMRAFNHLGYDAIGLGNHDFDFGLAALEAAVSKAPCPVLCSNLEMVGEAELPGVERWAVLAPAFAGGISLRVGVLSFLPPQTVRWSGPHLKGRAVVRDIVDTARQQVQALRRRGVDLVLVLAHSGLGSAEASPQMENALIPLAAIDGVDAIVGGHTHLAFPGPRHPGADASDGAVDFAGGRIHGKPVVMPGAAGSHLGVIDLDLETGANGRWRVAQARAALRPVAEQGDGGQGAPVTEDTGLARLIAPAHAETRAQMARPVGQTAHALHSYFSFLAPDRATAVVAAAQAAALRPHLAGTEAEGLPLLSAAAPAKSGGRLGPMHFADVPQGPVLTRHLTDLCPFPNDLRAVILTGAQVRDWLEHAVKRFAVIPRGSTGLALTDAAFPGHDFDVLHGLTYAIDLSARPRSPRDSAAPGAAARRVTDLRIDGDPVAADQRFVVALNSYRASGGGNVSALDETQSVPVPPTPIRAAVADYLSGRTAPDPLASAPPPWRFVALPGTSVLARTGPGARRYLTELDGRGIVCAGWDIDGFLRLSVPL